MRPVVLDQVMSDGESKTRPVRIGVKALEVAKIAAAFKGVSAVEYVTAVVLEAASRDVEDWYRARSAAPVKPKRPKGGEPS